MRSKLFQLTILSWFFVGSISTQAQTHEGRSFILQYYEPSEEMAFYAQLIIESGIFDEVVSDLEEEFNLPTPITIVFASGIEGPQYYQGVINMPYEFLAYNDQVLAASNFTADPEEAAEILLNLTEFVLYHEVGHAIVDVLDIPVLGKEEDAVDGFAALLASIWDLDEVALAAADVMAASASIADTEITDAQFWDSHSLDEQRMFAIFCLIYGSDPDQHTELLWEIGMPIEEKDRCQYEYAKTLRNWARVLGVEVYNNPNNSR